MGAGNIREGWRRCTWRVQAAGTAVRNTRSDFRPRLGWALGGGHSCSGPSDRGHGGKQMAKKRRRKDTGHEWTMAALRRRDRTWFIRCTHYKRPEESPAWISAEHSLALKRDTSSTGERLGAVFSALQPPCPDTRPTDSGRIAARPPRYRDAPQLQRSGSGLAATPTTTDRYNVRHLHHGYHFGYRDPAPSLRRRHRVSLKPRLWQRRRRSSPPSPSSRRPGRASSPLTS